jgi:hypothetical protein
MRYQDLLPALPVSFLHGAAALPPRHGASLPHRRRRVELLAVPLFRGGIKLFMLADRLFYTPRVELMKNGAR